MFGFLKRNLREIDSLKYQFLAVSASSNALALTIAMIAHSSSRKEETFMEIYQEALAFAVCLAQMRIQKRFRINDGHNIVEIVQEIQQQFRDLPVPRTIPPGQDFAVTRNILDNATTDGLLDLILFYGSSPKRVNDLEVKK